MVSAFDDRNPIDAEDIRKMFLAGNTMAEVRRFYPNIALKTIREMRDEVFEPLIADPDKVKSLANGPVLNANEIVRYRRPTERATRMARPRPVQIEMFPA